MLPELDINALQGRTTPIHCLLYWAQKQPNKVYFTQPQSDGTVVNYTWAQVADQVQRMAAYLQSLELPAESSIAIYGKNSAHWIMADLAIWLAGHITVPLYPTLNAETASYVFEHSEARLLFIGKLDGKADSWPQIEPIIPEHMRCITLPLAPEFKRSSAWADIVRRTDPSPQPTLPTPDSLASIIYTSGSTGQPKGVMHSFRTLMMVAQNVEGQFDLSSNERVLSYLPLAHGLERGVLENTSLYLGCHMFFADSLETFVDDLGRASPTLFISVPRLWTKFQHGINDKIPPRIQKAILHTPLANKVFGKFILKKLGLADVRIALTGSAPLPRSVLEWYRNLGLELHEGYGLTENLAYSHVNRKGANRIGYVGFPQQGVECRIGDEGEVQVKSPATMLGYYKEPEKTAETMTTDGYLKTGDAGEMDADGCLKLTGRLKDIFKTAKGKYITPVPIELKLAESPLIEMVCVGGCVLPQPIGLVMLEEETQRAIQQGRGRKEVQAALETLLAEVNETLEPHEKLAFIAVVSEPWTMENNLLTPTMKIRRQQIEDHYIDLFELWAKQKRRVVWV